MNTSSTNNIEISAHVDGQRNESFETRNYGDHFTRHWAWLEARGWDEGWAGGGGVENLKHLLFDDESIDPSWQVGYYYYE